MEIESSELRRCADCQVGQGDDCRCRPAPMPTLGDVLELLLWLVASATALWAVGRVFWALAELLGWR